MPKISWVKPRVNYLVVLLSAYRQQRKMTFDQLGKKLGCSAQNVKQQMGRPAGKWKIEQILEYCDALGIPYEEALKAAIQK